MGSPALSMSEISLKNMRSVIMKLTEIQIIKKKKYRSSVPQQTDSPMETQGKQTNFIVFPAYTKPLLFGVNCTRDPNYSFLSVAYSQ